MVQYWRIGSSGTAVASRPHPTLSPDRPHPEGSQGGTLYLVATPIGNLEDVTLRALRILKEVTLIAAEDTRRSAKLLRHYGIETPTTSFHKYNEKEKGAGLLARLEHGESLALVTDAGTPLMSDPGSQLVQDALAAGLAVQAIPGPSAILTALVMSGFASHSFTFLGFPPSRSNNRKTWLNDRIKESHPLVLFEAPHRVRATLTDIRAVLGERKISVCREMTKVYEDLVEGPISEVLESLSEPRGEFTLIIWPSKETTLSNVPLPASKDLWSEFCRLSKLPGSTRRATVKLLAEKYGLTAREAYAAVERGKDSSS